jgi:kynurenine formamidase
MRLLSYPLSPLTPTFLENPTVIFKQVSDIEQGGVANWFEIKTINHNGTHVDVPYHYWAKGKTLTDYSIADFIFERPFLVDLPKSDGELITKKDLISYASSFKDADLVLIRTGYADRYRSTDPVRYGNKAPGFNADAAEVLLADNSALRAVIMDFPSASSPLHLDTGNDFHREALGATGRNKHLFLIEDAKLDTDLSPQDLKRIFVVPLFLEGLDASQCTIIAEPF